MQDLNYDWESMHCVRIILLMKSIGKQFGLMDVTRNLSSCEFERTLLLIERLLELELTITVLRLVVSGAERWEVWMAKKHMD